MDGAPLGFSRRSVALDGAFLVGLGLILVGSGIAGPGMWGASGLPSPVQSPWGLHVHSVPPSPLTISGTVTGWGLPPSPVGGVNVTLVDQACGSVESPPSCPYADSAFTASNGSFELAAFPGSYFVYSHPVGRWGGAWLPLNVTATNRTADLRVYPWVPYGNASIVLPGWNNLSAYAANCNSAVSCGPGIGGTQCPLLSWTQDGAYYVNATDRLVFYSFSTGTIRNVAAWKPLYDDVMQYKGIENTEWITADGAYVYEFGCLQDCDSSLNSVVAFYAVNTTTGQTFFHNFTSFSDAQMRVNGEVQMLGENGNSSIAIAVTSIGTVFAFDIWGGGEWILGKLPFFEANNVYWIPTLNSLVDVEANGSSLDRIVELGLAGPSPGSSLTTVFSGTYGSKFVSNGVDGLYLNLSSRTMLVSEATGGGPFETQSFTYDHNGVLLANYSTLPETRVGLWPNDTVPPNAWSSEHRPLLSSYGPMVQGVWNGLFGNGSWQFEPATGEYLDTNVTLDHAPVSGKFRENSQSPASVENLFYNSSYAIISESVNCRTNGTACPIRGSSPSSVPGTIWWTWRSGLPEFPISGPGTIAEVGPPGPLVLSASNSTRTVTITWSVSPSDAVPPLNYTVFWGPLGAPWTHVEDVWAQNTSFTIRGLAPSTNLSIQVEEWNLHWHNAGSAISASTRAAPPGARILGFVATPNLLDAGMLVTLSTATAGGTPPLSYAYSGLPVGCPGGNVSQFVCTPRVAGSFSVVVSVQDVNGQLTQATMVLNITPALVPSLSASRNATDLGFGIPLVGTVGTTGAPPVLLRWSVGAIVGQGARFVAPASTVGTQTVLLSASDAVGGSASMVWKYAVNPDLRIGEFRAFPDPIPAGQSIHFVWSIEGGTAPITVSFGGFPVGCGPPSPNSTSWSCSVGATGTYRATVNLTDALGLTASSSLVLNVTSATPAQTGNPPANLLGPIALLSGAGSAALLAVGLHHRRLHRRVPVERRAP